MAHESTVDCTLYWRRVVRFYQGYIVKYISAVFFESRASTVSDYCPARHASVSVTMLQPQLLLVRSGGAREVTFKSYYPTHLLS